MGNLGICFVNPAPQIEPGYVTAMARKCDQAGLHSFWTIDRIAYDNLEALTVLAAAAGATENIRLGTSVLLSALRHPALLAKTVATLDFLSGGRMTLGIGFGSRENDFSSVEVPWEHRGTRAEESLGLMKRLWTEEEVEHHGRFFDLHSTRFGPRTVQSPHPPVWMGGTADTVLKRVGRLADGYICGSSAVHDFGRGLGQDQRPRPSRGAGPGQHREGRAHLHRHRRRQVQGRGGVQQLSRSLLRQGANGRGEVHAGGGAPTPARTASTGSLPADFRP